MINFAKELLNAFWGTSPLQYIFYAALFVVFLKEKDSANRRVFLWYPIVIFLGLLSPVSYYLGSKVWNGAVAYFCRQFSLLGVFFVIAFAIMKIIENTPSNRKILIFFFFCLIIMLFGNNIYRAGDYRIAENSYKVSSDVITICDKLSELETRDVVIATPTELSHQIRQYDSSVHLITWIRDSGPLPTSLSEEEPDVEYVMDTCCKKGCDYAIAKNTDKARMIYSDKGYKPVIETPNYLVYRCEGYSGYKINYGLNGLIEDKNYFGMDGEPVLNEKGYHRVHYVYDMNGFITEEWYYDVNNKLIVASMGYAGIKYSWNDYKRIVMREFYFGTDKRPMALGGGEKGKEIEYDKNRKVIREELLDEYGSPL